MSGMTGAAGAAGVIGPLWLLLQIEIPVFLLADALPTRKVPLPLRVLVVAALLSPVALHLIASWGDGTVDVAGYLLTFASLLLLSAASVWAVFSTSVWTAFFCSSAGYTAQGFATGVQGVLRGTARFPTTWFFSSRTLASTCCLFEKCAGVASSLWQTGACSPPLGCASLR